MKLDLSEKIGIIKKPLAFLFLLLYHLIFLPLFVIMKVMEVIMEWLVF